MTAQALSTPSRSSARGAGWIVSGSWDAVVVLSTLWVPLVLFVVWQLSGDVLPFAAQELSLALFLMLLSLPHFLTTATFTYLDPDQRAHYRSQPLLYYGAPLALLVGSYLYCVGVGPILLVSLWLWFGEHHVAAQNIGFASLYRQRNAEGDLDRRIDHAVFNLAWITTVFYYATRSSGGEVLEYIGRPVHTLEMPFRTEILTGLLALAVGAFLLFLGRQVQRKLRGEPVSVPKVLFMVTTWPSFLAVPFLVPDAAAALILRSGYHNVQYLGLVYLLNRRRCQARGPAERSGLLGYLVESGLFLYLAIHGLAGAAVWYLTEYLSGQPGAFNDLGIRFLFFPGAALAHFFLDGLTWRFGTRHARETVLPYLRPEEAASRVLHGEAASRA